jgi:glycosyltransferase involved in cell wall biosynthesis
VSPRVARRPDEERQRILVLVPHDPDADPRIGWVGDLCVAVADTLILGTTWSTERSGRAYRGDAIVERIYVPDTAGAPTKALNLVIARLQRMLSPAAPAQERMAGEAAVRSRWKGRGTVSIVRFLADWTWYWMIVEALYRRARAESIRPSLIVCHDLFGLIVGVRLKRLWGAPLLYDSHEYWPQANLLHEPWEESLLTRVERRLIRKADRIVTVSPPLAAHLERMYGVEGVLSVPNAVPTLHRRLPTRTSRAPVRFLLQGQLAAGRGLELLLDAWAEMDRHAVLQLRYVPNDYTAAIERRYASLFHSGLVETLPPVSEEELVEAAAEADVGVVPYVGPNLNHVYASPNKVSEYMQAGLALLVSSDMSYVMSLLKHFGCGVTYDPRRRETLRAAVDSIVRDPQELARMQKAAATATATEFNWEVVAKPYSEAITCLLGVREEIAEGG